MELPNMIKASVRRLLTGVSRYKRTGVLLRPLAMNGRLSSAIWQRLPVENSFQVELEPGVKFIYTSTHGDQIGRCLYWRGISYWESETISVFRKLARQARYVIDIGANTGVYTLIACAENQNARVMSVEPVPRIFSQLQTNVDANGWTDRCVLLEGAVADVTGSQVFHVPDVELPTSGSLHRDGFRNTPGTRITVAVKQIDELVEDRSAVDLVKIDVEGFEDKVLLGMSSVLEQSRPLLIIECNLDGPYRNVDNILRNYDYSAWHLRSEGMIPVGRVIPDPTETYRNFLFIHRDAKW